MTIALTNCLLAPLPDQISTSDATVALQLSKKTTPELARRGGLNPVKLREEVAGGYGVVKGAGRRVADRERGCIAAARRTTRNGAHRIQLDIGREVGRPNDGVTAGPVRFQRELVGRRVNLAEVVDAGVGLRGGACFHEVRNRDGRQQADDGHDNHDFYQREAR